MKIAFVTDDGTTISSHFGRAMYYEICTLDGESVIHRERIPKSGHHTHAQHLPGDAHAQGHGHDHGAMISPITDCTTLVARGMGMGAHTALLSMGITPILTDEQTIDIALGKFIAGSLSNNEGRVHHHGPGHGHQDHPAS
jgi:predicted Fe-Mo cluster-binding NifX family protein